MSGAVTPSGRTHRHVILIKLATVSIFIAMWELAARSGLFFEGVISPPLPVVSAVWGELVVGAAGVALSAE